MSKVIFEDADPYEKNPGFSTRLEKTFTRVHEVISSKRMWDLYKALGFAGVVIYFISMPERKELFEPLITVLGSLLIGYIGLIISVYWSIDGVYGRKWTLIFEKFYEINRIENKIDREFHFCNMWIDAITMGVWADEALNRPLYDHLKASLVATGEHQNSLNIKLHSYTLRKESAIWMLGEYADHLRKINGTSNSGGVSSLSPTPPNTPTKSPAGSTSENLPDDISPPSKIESEAI
jgi:hypothetical protein